MDPQQRLLLEVSWELLERSGYRPDSEKPSCGIFVGASGNEYAALLAATPDAGDPHLQSGNATSLVATRVAYLLNLHGPSMVVDTACSSSLTAVQVACQAIASGSANMAIAAGVNLVLNPEGTRMVGQYGMLASDGKVKAFDDRADGFVRGEGIAAVLLRPLADALHAGDQVWAVIKGIAINNDGQSRAGLAAPSPKSQGAVVREALRRADVTADSIGYLEAHGTGTALGDPIEVSGLMEAYADQTNRLSYCALGSVKSNLGHLEAAAGIAGLIKAVLAVKYAELPPTLHVDVPNRHISFERSPFFVNDRLRHWQTGTRRAGVSSFGFGGTNVHAIIEQPPANSRQTREVSPRPHLFTLSAKTERALHMLVEKFCMALASNEEWDLGAVCYTVNVCRKPHEHRLAVLADSKEQLLDRLQIARLTSDPLVRERSEIWSSDTHAKEAIPPRVSHWLESLSLESVSRLTRLCQGDAVRLLLESRTSTRPPPVEIAQAYSPALLGVLGWLFAQGEPIDFDALYPSENYAKVILPTYPFQQERYWFVGPADVGVGPEASESPGTGETRAAAAMALPASIQFPASQPRNQGVRHSVDRWLYQTQWIEKAISAHPTGHDPSVWILFDDGSWLGQRMTEKLRSLGRDVIEVCSGLAFADSGHGQLTVDIDRPSDYEEVFRRAGDQPVRCVHLWNCGAATESIWKPYELQASVMSLASLWKGWVRAGSRYRFDVRLITSQAQGFGNRAIDVVPQRGAAAGLFLSLPGEDPNVDYQTIDLHPRELEQHATFEKVLAECLSPPVDREVAIRAGARWVAEMRPIDFVSVGRRVPTLAIGGCYLVTGGLSGIGAAVARWLFERYRAKLVLVGRTFLPPETEWNRWLAEHRPEDPTSQRIRFIEQLTKAGAEVLAAQVNVADTTAMEELVCRARSRFGHIHGMFHAAGVTHDGRLGEKSRRYIEEVLAAKMTGALVLDEVTREDPPEVMVLFSSMAAQLGSPGQCEYVAANRYLDAFALWRQATGRPTVSIRWGWWGETGMGIALHQRRDAGGVLAPMSTTDGIAALERALQFDTPNLGVAAFATSNDQNRPETVNLPADDEPAGRETPVAVEEVLATTLSGLLETAREKLDRNATFVDLGLDSILVVRLSRAMEARYGCTLDFDVLRRYPNVHSLARYIEDQLSQRAAAEPDPGRAEA
jgi:3-oxoacyl-(acyl-carrier-protein) synthase/NAD(P)-dependent dehydrogenase (short-subunit alcohol dehydrogenase family)/aryl carrier-like protein